MTVHLSKIRKNVLKTRTENTLWATLISKNNGFMVGVEGCIIPLNLCGKIPTDSPRYETDSSHVYTMLVQGRRGREFIKEVREF